ncbi:MAG: hypothetical protein ACEY3J_04000 [Arsenophonus sp.]
MLTRLESCELTLEKALSEFEHII